LPRASLFGGAAGDRGFARVSRLENDVVQGRISMGVPPGTNFQKYSISEFV